MKNKNYSRRTFLSTVGIAGMAVPIGVHAATNTKSTNVALTDKQVIKSRFEELHSSPKRIINSNSQEVRFIQFLCENNIAGVASLFEEMQDFGNIPSVIDSPHGRFEGLTGIKTFAQIWLASFKAKFAYVTPIIQTVGNGRSVTELIVKIHQDNQIVHIPMAVCGELRPDGKLNEVRIYFFFKWVDGFSAYRKPIFKPAEGTPTDITLLTGCVREYYSALHDADKVRGLERILKITPDKMAYGGYRTDAAESMVIEKEGYKKVYTGIKSFIPSIMIIRFQTITDDGMNCVAEWTATITEEGIKGGVNSQCGIAAYERDEFGMLKSVRICDNLGFDKEIEKTIRQVVYKSN